MKLLSLSAILVAALSILISGVESFGYTPPVDPKKSEKTRISIQKKRYSRERKHGSSKAVVIFNPIGINTFNGYRFGDPRDIKSFVRRPIKQLELVVEAVMNRPLSQRAFKLFSVLIHLGAGRSMCNVTIPPAVFHGDRNGHADFAVKYLSRHAQSLERFTLYDLYAHNIDRILSYCSAVRYSKSLKVIDCRSSPTKTMKQIRQLDRNAVKPAQMRIDGMVLCEPSFIPQIHNFKTPLSFLGDNLGENDLPLVFSSVAREIVLRYVSWVSLNADNLAVPNTTLEILKVVHDQPSSFGGIGFFLDGLLEWVVVNAPNLKSVEITSFSKIEESPINGKGLKALASLKSLEKLLIHNVKIQSIDNLTFPSLRVLVLEDLVDHTFPSFKATNLEEVTIYFAFQVDGNLRDLSELLRTSQLRKFSITHEIAQKEDAMLAQTDLLKKVNRDRLQSFSYKPHFIQTDLKKWPNAFTPLTKGANEAFDDFLTSLKLINPNVMKHARIFLAFDGPMEWHCVVPALPVGLESLDVKFQLRHHPCEDIPHFARKFSSKIAQNIKEKLHRKKFIIRFDEGLCPHYDERVDFKEIQSPSVELVNALHANDHQILKKM